MVQFLAYFGGIGCKMEKGICTGVGHIDVKAKNYHKPDLTGAKNNLWFEAYNAAGEKAHWFQGPPKPAYIPGTLGDVGQNVLNFADRLTKNLDATKDNGRGEQVPIYDLSDDDRKEMSVALDAIRKIGRRVMAREMLETANSVIEETAGIFNLGANPTDEVVSEEPVKEAAAS
jgi:hypothetical protein